MMIDNSPEARKERRRRAQVKLIEGIIRGLEAGLEAKLLDPSDVATRARAVMTRAELTDDQKKRLLALAQFQN